MFVTSCHAIYSSVVSLLGSFVSNSSSGSCSSLYSSFCTRSLLLIHSCTIASRLFYHTPWCFFHTLLFLVMLLVSVITCFLVTWEFSLLFVFYYFQQFSQGLCQLHSISACLGRTYWFHSSSLTFLICLTKSFIYSSNVSYFSLGSLISLFYNSSEYKTTLCSSISFLHHRNSF